MPKRADPGPAPKHFVTDDEKQWVRRRLEETNYGVANLAKFCGVTRQAIYQLIDGKVRNIVYWPEILIALGTGSGKSPSGDDARLQEIIRRWPDLSDEDRALVEATALRLSRKS